MTVLTAIGVPLLVWLDDELLPEAHRQLDGLSCYVRLWRVLLGT